MIIKSLAPRLTAGTVTLLAAGAVLLEPATASAASSPGIATIPAPAQVVPDVPHCGPNVKSSHVVGRYKMRRATKKTSFRKAVLYCGRAGATGYGYRHLTPHVDQYFGGWGSFNFSITQTLLSKHITYRASNKTYTHRTPILECIYSKGLIVHWIFYAVTSSSTASIITAYGRKGATDKGYC